MSLVFYVYKITFEEVPHFYLGVRKCPDGKTPETDKYKGSPCSNKIYWEVYTPKKQVFAQYEDQREAYWVEYNLIVQNWNNKYCLNRGVPGEVHSEILSRNGKRVSQIWSSMIEGDPCLKELYVENARKCLSEYHIQRLQNEEENKKFLDQCSVNGRLTGASNIGKYNERKNDPDYINVRIQNGKKRKGMIWVTNGENNAMIWPNEFDNYQSKGYRRGRTNHG